MKSRHNHERSLQFDVVKYLRAVLPRDAVLFHVPNGGDMTETARKTAGGLGEFPGASDLMICWQGRLYCIELKVRADPLYGIKRTTYQQPEQKAFQAAIVRAGGFYAVVRHTDEVMELLAHWGIPSRETALLRAASSVRAMA